jgi:peroxiredoxin
VSLSVGDRIPSVTLTAMVDGQPSPTSSDDALGHGKVVLFAVPGAFTPTCSDQHLPGFVQHAEELRARGVDRVACVAVNDAFVLDAWARANDVGDTVLMLADGNAEFATAMGLEMDSRAFGMGIRSQRYVAVLDDGVVQELRVDENPLSTDASSADAILTAL